MAEINKMNIESSTTSGFEKVLIEEGLYNATLKEINDIPDCVKGSETWPRVALVFNVEAPDGVVEIGFIAMKKITPKNKLGVAIVALGGDIADGSMDVSKLYGNKAKVMVESWTDKEGDDRSTITKVKALQ